MLRIAVCDDFDNELQRIVDLTNEYLTDRGIVAELREFSHPDALLKALKKVNFHVFMLDMLMPMVSGLELSREIRRFNQNAQIIYISSDPSFALEAYSVNPIHYLIKPVVKETLFAGTYFVKASVSATDNNNACEATTTFIIRAREIFSEDISLSGIDEFYLYTGSNITPEPIVMIKESLLVKDIDYSLSFEDNTGIGSDAKVIVTLQGNYSGCAEKSFGIRYGTLSSEEFAASIAIPESNSNGWYKQDIIVAALGAWMIGSSPDGSVYEHELTYKLDKTLPEGNMTIRKNSLRSMLRTLFAGLFFSSDVDVIVGSSDALSGVSGVEIFKSDRKLSEEELEGVAWTQYTAAIHKTARETESFLYYTRITDGAGNSIIVVSDSVAFDTSLPVISGVEDQNSYYTGQVVYVTDNALDYVTLNGESFESGDSIPGNINATYVITARDKAGNSTTYTIYMKPVSDIGAALQLLDEKNLTLADFSLHSFRPVKIQYREPSLE